MEEGEWYQQHLPDSTFVFEPGPDVAFADDLITTGSVMAEGEWFQQHLHDSTFLFEPGPDVAFADDLITTGSVMAEGEWFQQHLHDSTFLFEPGPDVAFADDPMMLDDMNQTLGYPADTESYPPFDDGIHLLPDGAFADDPMMLNDMNQALGHQANAESYPPFDDGTHLLPDGAFADDPMMINDMNQTLGYPAGAESYPPFNDATHLLPTAATSFSAFHESNRTMLDVPALQATSQLDLTSTAPAPPHLPPPEMTYSGVNDTALHRAPGLHSLSNTCNTTVGQDDIRGNANSQQTQYATAEDWNRHRETFTKLYLDENKTLNEVKSIMKEQYGFNATDKMYKKRISDWKLHKNCKHIEKEEVLRLVDSISRLGVDLGNPMLNGRPVKMHVLERHRKKKRKAGSPSPNRLDCSTEVLSDGQSAKRARLHAPACVASISFSRIDDPTDYRNAEILIFQIDQYYRSKLEKDPHTVWDAWAKSSTGRRSKISYTFQGTKHTCIFDGHAVTVFQRFDSAIECLQDGHPREAWRMIQEGFAMVRPLLLQQPSNFFDALLNLCISLQQNSGTYGKVLQLLLSHLSDMSVEVHGEQHPISKVCRLLLHLCWKEPVIQLAQKKLRDVLKHCLEKGHRASVYAQLNVCRELAAQERYDEAERSLRDLVVVCGRTHGLDAFETVRVRSELGVAYYMMRRNSDAESMIEEVLQYCKKPGQCRYFYTHAKRYQGIICLDRGDHSAAEAHFWSALSSALVLYGPKNPITTRTCVLFQSVRSMNRQPGDDGTSTASPQCSKTPHEITDKPLERFSGPRSSSLSIASPQYSQAPKETTDKPLRRFLRPRSSSPSIASPQYSQALDKTTDKPVRRFSRPRSSSLPPMDNPDWVANFWDQHLYNA